MHVPKPGVQENFFLCDSGPGRDRILIFGRQSWLQHFVICDMWFADGIFSIAPSLFCQIYKIMVKNTEEFIQQFMLFHPTNNAPHT